MPRSRDPRKAWLGGELDVFFRMLEFKPIGAKDAEGRELFEPQTLVTKFSQRCEAVPFGEGFALLLPSRSEDVEHLPGVELEIGIRDGKPAIVAVRSLDGGPDLNQSVLRRIGLEQLRDALRYLAVRLELDEDGSVIGVYATSPRSADDASTFEERTADVDAASGKLLRPGRPRLDDGVLRGVAEVVIEARLRREPIDRAVLDAFDDLHTIAAAKKRIRLARKRGFLPTKEKENG